MKAKRLNLIPKSLLFKIPIKVDPALVATAIGLVVTLMAHGIWNYLELRGLRTELASKQNIAPTLADQQKSIEALSVKSKGPVSVSNQILSAQLPWADLFKELSLLIPNQAWLTSFKMKNNLGKPNVVLTGEAASQNIMADFFRNLEKSFYYNQIKMNYSERQADFMPAIYKFSFSTEAILSSAGGAKSTAGEKK